MTDSSSLNIIDAAWGGIQPKKFYLLAGSGAEKLAEKIVNDFRILDKCKVKKLNLSNFCDHPSADLKSQVMQQAGYNLRADAVETNTAIIATVENEWDLEGIEYTANVVAVVGIRQTAGESPTGFIIKTEKGHADSVRYDSIAAELA